MSLPVCTHAHLLRERLYHRGQWNDDPVRRVVDLCAECRAAFRAADIRLERADGSRWREPIPSAHPREPEGERHARPDELHSPAGGAGGGPRAADGPTTAEAATDPGGSPVEVDPAVRGTGVLTPGDGHLLDEPGNRAMAAQVAPSSPSTGGEEGLPLPVEVEAPVLPSVCSDCKQNLPLKARGRCRDCYNRWHRRNMRSKPLPAVAAQGLVVPPPEAVGTTPTSDHAREIHKLEKEIARLRGSLAAVRRTLAPVLGVEETVDTADSMASRVAQLVARLQAPEESTGRNLEEELAGALEDLEDREARLLAWDLWHQQQQLPDANHILLAGLLRLTRGARA